VHKQNAIAILSFLLKSSSCMK